MRYWTLPLMPDLDHSRSDVLSGGDFLANPDDVAEPVETEQLDKAELSRSIRELLGVDVEFERLSAGDLYKLYMALRNWGTLLQTAGRSARVNFQEKVLSKPVGELLKKPNIVPEIIGVDSGSKDGPLGLGILSGLRRVSQSPIVQDESAKD